VESHSRAAKPLCWWVLSVVELLRAGRQADLKRSKIAEAEERLGAARKYVQQLRGELQAARNETARQRAICESAEADIAEMHALARDEKKAARNVQQLERVVGQLTGAWREQLEDVKQQLPRLLGDSTLAAAACVYLGHLQPIQRTAALQAWQALAEAHGLACSPGFSLQRFAALSEGQLVAGAASDVRATMAPGLREALLLLALGCRPPLLLDTGGSSSHLLRAFQTWAASPPASKAAGRVDSSSPGHHDRQHKAMTRVFFSVHEEGLELRVAHAVCRGTQVVVDLVTACPAEVHLMERVVVAYEEQMRRCYKSRAQVPHLLFVRWRCEGQALDPALLALLNPLRLDSRGLELRGQLDEALLGLVTSGARAPLKEMNAKMWALEQERDRLEQAIVYSVAHTNSPLFADDSLVDATVSKAQQAMALRQQLPQLQARLQVGWRSC
ncbi:uncharacterized protein HaLaN_03310, partial [Haematococcus lacustris]